MLRTDEQKIRDAVKVIQPRAIELGLDIHIPESPHPVYGTLYVIEQRDVLAKETFPQEHPQSGLVYGTDSAGGIFAASRSDLFSNGPRRDRGSRKRHMRSGVTGGLGSSVPRHHVKHEGRRSPDGRKW